MQKPAKPRMGIRLKITLSFFLITFSTSVIGLVLGYFWGSRIIKDTIAREHIQMAQLMASSIDGTFNREVNKLTVHLTNTSLQEAVILGNARYKNTPEKNIQKYLLDMDKRWIPAVEDDPLIKDYLNSYMSIRLKKLVDTDDILKEMFITDKFGGLVATSGKTSDFYQADEKWWQRAFAGGKGKVFIGDIEFDESTNMLGVTFAMPILDYDKQVIGVCKAIAEIKHFFKVLEDFRVGQTGDALLVNETGYIIAHSNTEPLTVKLFNSEDFQKLLNNGRGWFITKHVLIPGHEGFQFVTFADITYPSLLDEGIKWRVVVRQNLQEVFAPLNTLILRLVVILFMLLAMLLPVGFIFGGIFIRPIRKLREGVEVIGKGNLDYKVDIRTGDEIEQLAYSFNQMAEDLKQSTASIDSLNKEISERKRAEEKLQESERKFRAIFDQTFQFIGLMTVEGVLIEVNRTAIEFSGIKEKDVLGKPFWEGPWWKHSKELQDKLRAGIKAAAKGEFIRFEATHPAADGSIHYVDFSLKPVKDDAGKVVLLIPEGREITERKRAEAAVAEEKERLFVTLRSIGDGVIVTDQQGKITIINKVAEDLTGHTEKDAVGKPLEEVFHIISGENRQRCKNPVTKVLETRGIVDLGNHILLVTKDGKEIAIDDSGAPILDKDGGIIGVILVFRDITKIKIAEEAIKRAYQMNRIILEKAPFGVFVANENGGIDYVNPAMLAISGNTYEQFKELDVFTLPTYKEKGLDKKFKAVLAGEAFFMENLEYASYYSGKKSVRNMTGMPFEEEGRKKALIFVEDITEQKNKELAIRQANEEWVRTFESIADMVFIHDRNNIIIKANKAFLDTMKLKAENVIGKKCFELIHKTKTPWKDCPFEATKNDNLAHTEEVYDQAVGIPLLVTTSPILNDKKEITGCVHIARDISAIKKSEGLRQRLAAIVDSSDDAIISENLEGMIISWNIGAEKIYGYTAKEAIGKPVSMLLLPGGISDLPMIMEKIKRGESINHYETVRVRKDGRKIDVSLTMSPMKDEFGNIIGASTIARDISENKKLEHLKDEFISTVSHELRTPLSIIKEGVSLVLEGIPGTINEKQGQILGSAKNNIDRLARIINELLDISKIEAGKMEIKRESVNLTDMINSLVSLFSFRAKEKGLQFKVNLPAQGINIYVDADKTTQVLGNLLDNAIKFTKQGSVEISALAKNDFVECIVQDTGVGIAQEDLSKVFDKFQQFGRRDGPGEKGTGLGLSIAKAIIELHGGKMELESKENQGTKFTFTIPQYTYATLAKDYIKQGIKVAQENNSRFSLVLVAIPGFTALKQTLPAEKLRKILQDGEELIRDNFRRAGDNVLQDSGEIILFLNDCNKESALRVIGRLEAAIEGYLVASQFKDKIQLKFSCSTYPDEAKTAEELMNNLRSASSEKRA
ncbi:MAG: PAS domain S-box protein [Candidatus Omnitrophica bacterium]|jgi:PAS domain S-box-containing protein|nr:PAS domain S-box protein [Candidatus Omnitrophota bacterium]